MSTSARRGGTRQARAGRAAGRPLPRGHSMYTPGARPGRQRVERASAQPLVLLHQLPAWLVPVLVTALLVAGLTVRGVLGSAALVIVAGFLGWLAYLSWPSLAPRARLLRAAALAGLLAVAAIQALR